MTTNDWETRLSRLTIVIRSDTCYLQLNLNTSRVSIWLWIKPWKKLTTTFHLEASLNITFSFSNINIFLYRTEIRLKIQVSQLFFSTEKITQNLMQHDIDEVKLIQVCIIIIISWCLLCQFTFEYLDRKLLV